MTAMIAENPQVGTYVEDMFVGTNLGAEYEVWYSDSEASHHCTPSSSNLEVKAEYKGFNKVLFGNRTSLNISSVDQSSFTSNDHVFRLKNMLHIPHITKNLISISKFTKDNNVIFEFDSNGCFVKEKITRRIMLKGKLHNGLYAFVLPTYFHIKPHNNCNNLMMML